MRRPTVDRARQLRRELTPPELRLWLRLKQRPYGLKFRNQHPIDPYVADFYCAAAKLIVEIDGEIHGDPEIIAQDEKRQVALIAAGYHVVRIPARDIMRDADEAADAVARYTLSRLPVHGEVARSAGGGAEAGADLAGMAPAATPPPPFGHLPASGETEAYTFGRAGRRA